MHEKRDYSKNLNLKNPKKIYYYTQNNQEK